jgi:hypothetical protein
LQLLSSSQKQPSVPTNGHERFSETLFTQIGGRLTGFGLLASGFPTVVSGPAASTLFLSLLEMQIFGSRL